MLYEDGPGVYVSWEVFGADDDGVLAWVEGTDFEGEVFLFGVEAVPAGQESRSRVAFVGMTRATDLLYLTYTRMNPLLDRATKAPELCEFRSWPDDF